MRPSPLLLLTCLSFFAAEADAQSRHRNWYFGFGAAVDMGTVPPISLGTSSMTTDEGVASISDAGGALLFYTNGETIWNRDHAPMPNGTGLGGHFSASQSALIVAVPGSTDRYYVFTVPAQLLVVGGLQPMLRWSMVDMTLDGGLGDVTDKNMPLSGPVTEKLSATRHANGQDVWVAVHGWNNAQYEAYRITCTGIEGPVVSTAGRYMGSVALDQNTSAIGCMQFSAQGDRLAATWTDVSIDFQYTAQLDVVDFDNATGIFSGGLSDTHGSGEHTRFGYGVAFSPSGRFLYASEYGLNGGISACQIRQYDLDNADPMAWEATIITSSIAFGSLQRGMDGSIYAARLDGLAYLSRIDAPDLAGAACGMSEFAIPLGATLSTWGLPNDWDFSDGVPTLPEPIAWTDTTVCTGNSVVVDATGEGAYADADYLWNTGSTDPVLDVSLDGTYTVEVMLPCTTLYDTVRIVVRDGQLDLGPDLALCEGDSAVLHVPVSEAILWSDGGTDTSMTALAEGEHWVMVTSSTGCIQRDAVYLDLRDCRCPLFLPNAFTPGDDAINDVWGAVYSCDLLQFELALFNRWGGEIFRTDDPDVKWDGAGAEGPPQGVYTWTMTYAWHDGEQRRERTDRGHVTVVH